MQYNQTMVIERSKLQNSIEFVDAHCHLNLIDKLDLEDILSDARNRGVGIFITAGGSAKDNFESARLAERDHVFAVVGIGPDFAASDSGYVVEIEGLIKNSRKIIGIGEIGLDAKAAEKNGMELQRNIFVKQLEIAKRLELPVVIHSRGAIEEVMKTVIEMGTRRAMFHFFEGDENQAEELIKRGYLISIPPVMTGKRKRIIQEADLKGIVVETDSPVVGKTPADVIGVCETIAEIRGMTLEEVATRTTENIRRLFYI